MWEKQQDGAYQTMFLPDYKRLDSRNAVEDRVTILPHWNTDKAGPTI